MLGRLISFLIPLLLIAGCSSPLEKCVLYPLETDEIDKVVREDNSFLTTYSIVEGKWNHISTPADSSRWENLTYGRLHSYLKTTSSDELNSPLFSGLRNKWEAMNGKNNRAVDSLVLLWKNYLNSNSPDSVVSARFAGIELERIRNANKEIDTLLKARIMVKALKGNVDSVLFLYSFSAWNIPAMYYYPYNGTINPLRHFKTIRDSVLVKVFPYIPDTIRDAVISGDSTVVFNYIVHSVYKDGKCFNVDSLKKEVPSPVLALIESEEESNLPLFNAGIYREQIIREYIDPEFISQSAYIKLNAEHYYREIDSLAFSFVNHRNQHL